MSLEYIILLDPTLIETICFTRKSKTKALLQWWHLLTEVLKAEFIRLRANKTFFSSWSKD